VRKISQVGKTTLKPTHARPFYGVWRLASDNHGKDGSFVSFIHSCIFYRSYHAMQRQLE